MTFIRKCTWKTKFLGTSSKGLLQTPSDRISLCIHIDWKSCSQLPARSGILRLLLEVVYWPSGSKVTYPTINLDFLGILVKLNFPRNFSYSFNWFCLQTGSEEKVTGSKVWTIGRVSNCLDAHLGQIVCNKDGDVEWCIVLVEMALTRFEECWPLLTENLNIVTLTLTLWPINSGVLTSLFLPHLSSSLTDSLPSLNILCHSKTDARFIQDAPKAVWIIPYVSMAFFPSLKQNFIANRSFKVSSRPDCIFEIPQLWQSGFNRVYSNCCCSCSFEPEIIKISHSSHKMYSNNIVNSQESTTILNAHTKKVWNLIVCNS